MTAADCLCRTARERLDEGNFAGAAEAARAGLLRDNFHAGLLQMYGVAAYHLNDAVGALAALELASLAAPLDALSRLTLADLYARTGFPLAARAAARFLAEPGRCPLPLMPDLARVLGSVGAYRAALKVCKRIVAARPWYHPAHYGIAYYLAKLEGPPARVLFHLRAAHELVPHALTYRVALADALAATGEPEGACELIREVPVAALGCPRSVARLQGAAEDAGEVLLAMCLRDRARELAGGLDNRPHDDPT